MRMESVLHLHLSLWGLRKIVACSHSSSQCLLSFWHGVIPTSYFIFILVYIEECPVCVHEYGECFRDSSVPVSPGLSWCGVAVRWIWTSGVGPHGHHGRPWAAVVQGTVHRLLVQQCYEQEKTWERAKELLGTGETRNLGPVADQGTKNQLSEPKTRYYDCVDT